MRQRFFLIQNLIGLMGLVFVKSFGQGLPSYPGWRNYILNNEAFVDKENGKYFVTDGVYDIVPGVRFDERLKAQDFVSWLTFDDQKPWVQQYAPQWDKPYFSFFIGKSYRALPGEVCVDFLSTALRRDHENDKLYLTPAQNYTKLVGPFESDDDGYTAQHIVEDFKFTRFCNFPKSNLGFFRKMIKKVQ